MPVEKKQQQQRPFVILASPYNGDMSAKYLLQSVYDHVDEIILVEAKQTYSGIEKEYFFHVKFRTELIPFKSKLSILEIDMFPPMPKQWEPYLGMPEEEKNSWFREFYQRNIVKEYIDSKYGDKQWIVFCCDADEIINGDTMQKLVEEATDDFEKFNKPHYLEMEHFYFNFNWLQRNEKWRLAFVCNSNSFLNKSFVNIRIDARDATGQYIIPDGGWHCSFFASLKDIVRKIESYSHRSLDQPIIKGESHISKCLREGLDIFIPLNSKPFRGDTSLLKFDSTKLPKFLWAFQAEVLAAQAQKN
jgi:hypothetical protein